MASPNVWPFGLAGTGVDTATLLPDLFSSSVIWLNNAVGSDANAGTQPEAPLKTCAQAVTNASAGSVIAIAATHNEVLSSAVTANVAGIRFVGFGTGTSRATFQTASGATAGFTVSAIDNVFENIYFKSAQATAGAAGRVSTSVSGTEFYGCQFDCGTSDQECLIFTNGADNSRIDGCTFTAIAATPTRCIKYAGSPNTNAKIVNTTVDGAAFGWSAIAVTTDAAVHLVIKNLTLAGQSDMTGAAVPTYQMFGVTSSAAGRVTIT